MSKLKSLITHSLIIMSLFLVSFGAQAALLQDNAIQNINENTGAVQNAAGYDPGATVGSVIATVIKAFLALLGVIFVMLVVIAGFNWMTAGGDEEKIKKAKETISRAIIGLIIIVAAYSITYFVFANLPGSSGGSSL